MPREDSKAVLVFYSFSTSYNPTLLLPFIPLIPPIFPPLFPLINQY